MAEAASGLEGLRSLSLRLADSVAKLKTLCHGIQQNGPTTFHETVFEIETLGQILLQIEQDRQTNAGQFDNDIVLRCLEMCRQGVDRIGSATSELEKAPTLDDTHALTLYEEVERAKSTLIAAYGLYTNARCTTSPRPAMYNVSGSTTYSEISISGSARVHNGHNYGNVTNHFYTEPGLSPAQNASVQAHDQSLESAVRVLADIAQQLTGCRNGEAQANGLWKPQTRVTGNRTQKPGFKRSFALRLRPWLVSKTWSVSLWQSSNGWDLSLRSDGLVKLTAPIALACLSGVRKSMRRSKASPHDCWHVLSRSRVEQTPFKEAFANGHFKSARYPQSLRASADPPSLAYHGGESYEEWQCTNQEVVRMVIQELGMETGTLLASRIKWSDYQDVEGIALLRDGSGVPYETLPLQERFSSAVALDIHIARDIFHMVLGEYLSAADLVQMRDDEGGTIVHHVATRLTGIHRKPDLLFLSLLIEAVKAGADVGQTNFRGDTPLSAALRTNRTNLPGSFLAESQGFLKVWICWLNIAGFDLVRYGEREHAYFPAWCRVTYGPKPEDWNLWPLATVQIPVRRPRRVPGSWPVTDTLPVPDVLPWKPTVDDFALLPSWAQYTSAWEQGSQAILRSSISANSDDLMDPDALQQLLGSSQDDTGLAVMLTTRRSGYDAHDRRSSSQPPPNRSQILYGRPPTGRNWIGDCHWCSLDGRWRLSDNHYQDNDGVPENCRRCIQGAHSIAERWEAIDEQMFLFRKLFSSLDELHDLPYAAYREQDWADRELYDLGWDGCKRAWYGID